MAQITKTRIKQIQDVLAESYFTSAGFITSFPDQGDSLAVVTFLDNPKFEFYLKDNYREGFKVEYMPGNVKLSTAFIIKEFGECLEQIKNWITNVRNELAASSPLYDELENLKKEFADKLDEHVKDSSQHFTKIEMQNLESRLDEIRKNLDELREQQIITARDLELAKDMLHELQANLDKMPKKTWYRAAGGKIIEVMGKFVMSEQGQKLIGNVSAKLLDLPK